MTRKADRLPHRTRQKTPHAIVDVMKVVFFRGSLGKAIFGEQEAFEKKSYNQIKEEILKQILENFTPETWANMESNSRRLITYNSLGLKAIATLFGIKGNPIGYTNIRPLAQ